MPSKPKKGKERLDKYYYLAKEQGYRSRAAFKLIQLNKKYDFLTSAKVVIDLCAAPGGWLQVARKYQPMTGLTIGVDLATIKKIPGVITFVGDITTQKCFSRLRQECQHQKADAVLHDGAPNVGANWFKDAYTQSELVLYSLKIACEMLRPGGVFVTKVFRSKDYQATLWLMNQFFNKVDVTKPKASRNVSAEIYVIGLGYKAPKEIDPKLFNASYVFEEVQQEKRNLKAMTPRELAKRKNRNRDGYEDDNLILYKEIPVSQFIETNQPIAILVEYNKLIFDENSQKYKTNSATDAEVLALCDDLKVLNMGDFKYLLKWRSKLRKEFAQDAEQDDDMEEEDEEEEDVTSALKNTTMEDVDGEQPNADDGKDEETLKKELDELRDKTLKYKKNLLKREKLKALKRMPTAGTEKPSDILDNIDDMDAFRLASIYSKEELEEALKETNIDAADIALEEMENEDALRKMKEAKKKQVTEDEYEELVDDQLESMYKTYLQKKGKAEERRRTLFEKLNKKVETEDLYNEDATASNDNIEYEENKNPLLAQFEDNSSANRKKSQWFSQNIFDVLNEDISGEEPRNRKARKLSDGSKAFVEESEDDASSVSDSSDDDSDSDGEDYDDIRKSVGKGGIPDEENDGFEEVPKEMLESEDTAAQTLALAKKLLRKKDRMEFIDNSFNRRAFNDDDLPEWFEDDQAVANKPILPVTKEEVEKEKLRLAEINARPIKKVLEAKYRKKKRVARKLDKMKEKANMIAESQELSNLEKAKELQKLYKSAMPKKPEKVYVVAKKFKAGAGVSGRGKGGAVVKTVDTRMKKDRRAEKRKRK